MLALSLPPILDRFMDWAEKNPALGVVAVLALVVVMLWLVRKSIKFFMVVCLLLVVVILGSYAYYGKDKTNRTVRENLREVVDEGKELLDKAKDSLESPESDGQPADDGQ